MKKKERSGKNRALAQLDVEQGEKKEEGEKGGLRKNEGESARTRCKLEEGNENRMRERRHFSRALKMSQKRKVKKNKPSRREDRKCRQHSKKSRIDETCKGRKKGFYLPPILRCLI